ncbi:MAG TPA: DUF4157 domain-containing protein [Parasulfuritortus sp.]
MAAPAPPAETRKPASPPPAKAGKPAGEKAADTKAGKAPDQTKAGQPGSAGKQAAGDKSPAAASQQRFDRLAVRAKLAVSQPGDAVEREADDLADKVMRMPDAEAGHKPATPAAPDTVARLAEPRKADPAQAGKQPPSRQNAAKGQPAIPAVPAGTPHPATTAGTRGGLATVGSGERAEVARAPGAGENDAAPEVPADIMARLGPGEPLDVDIRARFERKLGHDLADVRVHTDSAAQEAALQINARAFTFGHHIAFANGQYRPGTQSGDRLIAHELVHVLQQRRSVTRQIMRDKGPDSDKVEVKGVTIPAFKFSYYSGKTFERPPGYNRAEEGSKQLSLWRKQTKQARDDFAKKYGLADDGVYVAVPKAVKLSAETPDVLVGQPKAIADLVGKPRWDDHGKPESYDIDHMIELQIGGKDFDKPDNLELRDATSNRSSGSSIDASINAELTKLKDTESGDAEKIRAKYTLVFSDFKSGGAGGKTSSWSQADINALEGAKKGLKVYDPDRNGDSGLILGWPTGVDKAAFFGGPDLFVLYPSKSGGQPVQIKLGPNKKPTNAKQLNEGWIPGFKLSAFDLNLSGGDKLGSLKATLDIPQLSSSGTDTTMDFPIQRLSGKLSQAGFISTVGARNKIAKAFGVKPMSPVEITELDILPGTGLLLQGVITPNLPLLNKTPIDLLVQGKRLQVSKTFSAGELSLPGPFKITGSSLTVALATDIGFSVTGVVVYVLQGLGEGSLVGKGRMGSFSIAGDFVFDRKLFDGQAVLKASYTKEGEADGKFSGEADVSIGNKIRGIKSAKIHVLVDNDKFEADGKAEPDIPGIKQFSLAIKFENAESFSVSGKGELAKLPGIKSGELNLTLKRDGEAWSLSGSGDITPDIPGIDTQLHGSYDKGLVLIEGTVAFSYGDGLISGSGKVGVTNGEVDEKGNVGGEGGKDYKAFGSADLTAKLGPVSGTVKLKVSDKGKVEIGGKLTMPDQKLFDQYPKGDAAKHNLVKIKTPSIPLVGIPLGGIVLFADFSIDAIASVGPGMVKNIGVELEPFDPSVFQVENLKIKGGAELEIPAQAGISLSAGVNIAAEVLIAQLGGNVTVTASAGIPPDPPAVRGKTDFTWSKADGFDIQNTLSINAQPKATFSLSGELYARANLYIDTITLWSRTWPLGQVSYDLPLSVTASATFGWNSRTGFRFDPAKDIQIPPPKLEAKDFLNMLEGKPSTQKTETTDRDGKKVTDPNELVSRAAPEQNASYSPTQPSQSVMPKRADDAASAPATVDEDVVQRLGIGLPLDLGTRGWFEQRLGADLTRVRIHTGPGAARETQRLGARAFTVGEHIAFAAGEYRPDTPEGQELIAHELVHVVQGQGGGAIVLRWPAVTRTPARTSETPATVRAMKLADFVSLTHRQLDWATSPDLQADPASLGQFRQIQSFADGPRVVDACGDLGLADILGKGVPGIFPTLNKYRDGVTSDATAWLRRTAIIDEAERWGRGLASLEAAWPAANLHLVMQAPDPVSTPSPFEKLTPAAAPELPSFIAYLTACTPVLSAENGAEVDSFLALRAEGATPASYLGTVRHVKDYHHFTKNTLDGLASNEAFPHWQQALAWTRRPLTVVLYPAVDHNGAFHRNAGLEAMVLDTNILTIVVEGLATVADYRAQLAPVAARYGVGGRIQQAMIAGHGNATVLGLAGTAGAAISGDDLGTTGATGANTTSLMTELTRLMSSDPARRRIILDACLTNSHQVTTALRAAPADAAADVNAAITADPSLRDVVAGIAGSGATVLGSSSSFAPGLTTFVRPGSSQLGLSVPDDPDLTADKLTYVEFGTEPEGCMRAVLECWAQDQLAGTHRCRDAMQRRITAGRSTHAAATDSWRECIIQPLYYLTVNHYLGNGEAIREMGELAGSLFLLYWPGFTTAASLDAALGVFAGNAAHIGRVLGGPAGDPHYAATPRVAVVIEQAWMEHDPARHANFLAALGRYANCLQAAADLDMGIVMRHVAALLTLPPASPPPAAQFMLALLAAHQAPLAPPLPAVLPPYVDFLRSLLGAGPTFPAALNINTVLGGLCAEEDILAAIGRPLGRPAAAVGGRPPPPAANIDTVRDASSRNEFYVTPLRRNGVVATVRDDLLVRSTPTTGSSANIFAHLPTGTPVFVIGQYSVDWYAIEQPGRTGFVASRYITLLP